MAIESATAVVSGISYVLELVKTVKDAETKSALLNALIDVQLKTTALQDENSRLKEEIKQLKDTKELEEKVIRHEHLYITLKGDEKNIKYCAICYGERSKFIQLAHIRGRGEYWCPSCKEVMASRLNDAGIE